MHQKEAPLIDIERRPFARDGLAICNVSLSNSFFPKEVSVSNDSYKKKRDRDVKMLIKSAEKRERENVIYLGAANFCKLFFSCHWNKN